MGQTVNDQFYIWGEYGWVVFPSVTIKRKARLDHVEGSCSDSSCSDSSDSENEHDNSGKQGKKDSKKSDKKSDQKSDKPAKCEEYEHGEIKRSINVKYDHGQNEKNETREQQKAREEKEIEEKIKNNDLEYDEYFHLKLFEPKKVQAHSLEEIVARRFNKSYHTIKFMEGELVDLDIHQGDLIDLSDVIVIKYEYYVDYEEEMKRKEDEDKYKKKYKKEKKKKKKCEPPTYVINNKYKNHYGNKETTHTLLNKSNLSEMDGFSISGVKQSG